MKIKRTAAVILIGVLCLVLGFSGCHQKEGKETVSSPSSPSSEQSTQSPTCASDLEHTTWAICDGIAFDQKSGRAVTGDLVADAANNLTYQFEENGKVIVSQTGEDDQEGNYTFKDSVITIIVNKTTVNGAMRDGKMVFITEGNTLAFSRK